MGFGTSADHAGSHRHCSSIHRPSTDDGDLESGRSRDSILDCRAPAIMGGQCLAKPIAGRRIS